MVPFVPQGARENVAFTLAEVLITLGIIGIVAALTLPTLIQNHQKKEVTTKLAKVYSVMNQAIKMSSVVNGEPKDWVKNCGLSSAPTCTIEEVEDWFNEYLGKYLQVSKTEIKDVPVSFGSLDRKEVLLVYLNDGTILGITSYIYDINVYLNNRAIVSPNAGRNLFAFRFKNFLLTEADVMVNVNAKLGMFEPYTFEWDGTREGLKDEENSFSCSRKTSKTHCAKLIQYDGWNIAEDYPW